MWRSPCLPSPFLNPLPEIRRDGQFEPQGALGTDSLGGGFKHFLFLPLGDDPF